MCISDASNRAIRKVDEDIFLKLELILSNYEAQFLLQYHYTNNFSRFPIYPLHTRSIFSCLLTLQIQVYNH
jgi:hypothetical protein